MSQNEFMETTHICINAEVSHKHMESNQRVDEIRQYML